MCYRFGRCRHSWIATASSLAKSLRELDQTAMFGIEEQGGRGGDGEGKQRKQMQKSTRLLHKQRMSCHAKLCLQMWSMLRTELATFWSFEPHGRGEGPRLTKKVLIIDVPGSTGDHREYSEIRTRQQIHRTLVEIGV